MLAIILISYLVSYCYTVGSIKGFGILPITQTISNLSETADYTFNFILESELDEDGYLEIIFPLEFLNTITLTPECSVMCTGSSRTFELNFNDILYPNLPYSATIYGITNPSALLGIGNFVLRTKKGANIIDESLLLGSAGTADEISPLISASVSVDGLASYAGELTRYSFSFKTTTILPKNIQITIILPSNAFGISNNPSCNTFPINNEKIKATLKCEYNNDKIFVKGFEQELVKGSPVGFSLTMRNPLYSTVTDDFAFYIYKLNTSSVLARKEGIKGISITPGKITEVKLRPLDQLYSLTKSKLMWFRLSFKVRNPLPKDSYIEINLPVNFLIYDTPTTILGTPWSYYVLRGLEDSDNSLIITKDTVNGSDKLLITDYAETTNPGEIVVVFLATLPNSAGKTSPIQIKTYLVDDSEIDNNITDGFVDIKDVPTPADLNVITSVTEADGKSFVDLSFDIVFGLLIPSGSTIRLLFDEALTVNSVVEANCKMLDSTNNIMVNASNCYRTDRYVYIITSQDFELGINKPLDLTGIIRSPRHAGRYFIEMNTYIPNNNLVQSTTIILTFDPKPLDNPNIGVYPQQLDQKSVFDISFTLPYELANSLPIHTYVDSISFIELEFENVNDPSLGFGLGMGDEAIIPCKSTFGLVPYTGNSITCKIEVDVNPKIKIFNYQNAYQNEWINILIPKILNPSTAWNLYIRLVAKNNRLLTLLTESVFAMTTNVAVPAGLDTIVLNSPDTFYTVSNKNIGNLFETSFTIISTNQIQAYSKIIIELPSYGNNFLTEESYPTCSILNQYFRCFHFHEIDWIYVEIDNNILNPVATSLITLKNLTWPLYVPTVLPSVYNAFTFVDSNGMIQNIMLYPPFPRTDEGQITYSHINLDKKYRNSVNCTYKFTFMLDVDILYDSTIIITFPADYDISAADPSAFIESAELTKINENTTFSFTSNEVTISNVGFIPKNYSFKIYVVGIRNPNTFAVLNNWSVLIEFNGHKIAESTSFFSFTLMNEPQTGRIYIEEIIPFPNNKDIFAEYTFKFSLQNSLRTGARIYIDFPPEYSDIPNNPVCFIKGGLTTFKQCEKISNSIYLELDKSYISGTIELTINDIKNPNVENSDAFYIYTQYDSRLIDETKADSTELLQVYFSDISASIEMKEFGYEPSNQAMLADYTIAFIPDNDIENGMHIVVDFPDTFDRILGYNIDLLIVEGLQGNIKFEIRNTRLFISNFNYYNKSTEAPIKFVIKNVMNPNKPETGNNGNLSIGILKSNRKEYQNYIENFGIIETEDSPMPLEIKNIVASNTYSRLLADYYFDLNLPVEVDNSASGGQILIYLPDEFENGDQKLDCNINSMALQCFWKNKTITVKGHITKLFGDINLTVRKILNPLEEIRTGSIHLATYNDNSKHITSKSYTNLDYINFEYTFPGPLIIINDDKPIYIESGAQSRDVDLIMTDISALNLIIQGTSDKIKIVPQEIKLNIGENAKKIRFSVPNDVNKGEYYVTWMTNGDLDPPMYTPLRKTKIIVTQKKGIPVRVGEINDIPFGGSSLAVPIHTDFAPDSGFEVLLNLSTPDIAVSLNTTTVSFDSGQNTAYFSLTYLNDTNTIAQSGTIDLALDGINKEIYSLDKSTLSFNIVSKIERVPELLDLQVENVTQTNVTVYYASSDIASAYYVISLAGSEPPDNEIFVNKGPSISDKLESQFGLINIGKELNGYLFLENLTAETEYVIYILLMNRDLSFMDIPSSITFKTGKRYNTAILELGFSQTYINAAEKTRIFNHLAFLMSLENEKVEETLYDYDIKEITNYRGVEPSTDGGYTILRCNVIAVPTSNVYPPPTVLSKRLLNRKDSIKEKFPNYDYNSNILIYEFIR